MTVVLKASQVLAFRTELEALLDQLRAELDEDKRHTDGQQAGVIGVHDSGDDAEASAELALNLEAQAHHSEEVAECLAAIQRIESGEFGSCTDCGEEIELSRLNACPTAARCIRCQTSFEAHNQQRSA